MSTLTVLHGTELMIVSFHRDLMAQFSDKAELTIPSVDGAVIETRPPPLPPSGTGRILLITVTSIQHPITIPALYDAFSRCGTVERIVTFNKGGREQALVQFEKPEMAAAAAERLQGRSMYSAGNVLGIQYSKLPHVTIKCNSERAHDFAGLSSPPREHRE